MFDDLSRMGEPEKCGARSHQTGLPCSRHPIPFGKRCIFHGGNDPRAREKARKEMLRYMQFSPDPAFVKRHRLRRWVESNRRWEMRKAKKRGPEFVAALKAEWAAQEAERKAWIEDKRRARLEVREEQKRQYREQAATPPEVQQPGYIETGFDWSDL